jgi:hypothetical protein
MLFRYVLQILLFTITVIVFTITMGGINEGVTQNGQNREKNRNER